MSSVEAADPIPYTRPTRPALRYFGAKWMLAPWYVDIMPPHHRYVEPWCGSCAMLLSKPPSKKEIANDLYGEVLNFFDVIRDHTDELVRRISLTPYHSLELVRSETDHSDPIERARRFFVLSWQNRNGRRASESQLSFRRSTSSTSPNVVRCWNQVDHLYEIASRLKQVMFESHDWRWCVDYYDAPDTLFFCDPPYLPVTRSDRWGSGSYAHEMTQDDHTLMLEVLNSVSGMVMLCGYPSELYDDTLAGWERHTCKAKTDGGVRVECLWLNPAASNRQKGRLF